jgi:hypothetical protein
VAAAAVVQWSAAQSLREKRPALAAQVAPWNGRIALDAALDRIENGAAPTDPAVQALARRALRRDATLPAAIELAALARESRGDRADAAALYRLSDRIGRRSLATRLWLVQDAVERGDVTATLAQMDIALRTSSAAPEIVFPALARGIEDPQLVAPVAVLVDRPSEWSEAFLDHAVAAAEPEAAAALLLAVRNERAVTDRELDRLLIVRLVEAGRFALARRIDARFAARKLASVPLADGDFADPASRYPFGWGLTDRSGIGARRETRNGRPALAYHAAAAQGGQVAAQLLTLGEGNHLLQTRAASSDGSRMRPIWVLSCAGQSRTIATLPVPVGENADAAVPFAVPGDCPAQWLVLSLRPALAPQSGSIAGVSISGS